MDKILFVDHDSKILSTLQRQFHKYYDVHTVLGAKNALNVIAEEGPFAVIVTSLQMPEVNGLQFLLAAQKIAPDSVRIMLTANKDHNAAVMAINEAHIFSFLTKPCPTGRILSTLQAAVKQYHSNPAKQTTTAKQTSTTEQTNTSEQDLIDTTLSGSVNLLMDMMSMVAPGIYGRTVAIRDAAKMLQQEIEVDNSADLEMAAMLCNLGSVTLPPDTTKKRDAGAELTEDEQKMVMRLPEVSRNLIANIPRLQDVSKIVYYHQKNYDGSGFPPEKIEGEDIPVESRILKILTSLEQLKAKGMDEDDAIMEMVEHQGTFYDPHIFKMVTVTLSAHDMSKDKITVMTVSLSGLAAGQELVSKIETVDGRLLFGVGSKLTDTIIERLRNYDRVSKIKEPIKVLSSRDATSMAERVAG